MLIIKNAVILLSLHMKIKYSIKWMLCDFIPRCYRWVPQEATSPLGRFVHRGLVRWG